MRGNHSKGVDRFVCLITVTLDWFNICISTACFLIFTCHVLYQLRHPSEWTRFFLQLGSQLEFSLFFWKKWKKFFQGLLYSRNWFFVSMPNVRKNKAATILNRNGFAFKIGSSQSCACYQKTQTVFTVFTKILPTTQLVTGHFRVFAKK